MGRLLQDRARLLKAQRYYDRYGFSLANRNKYEVVRDIHLARCEYLETHDLKDCLPKWQLVSSIHASKWLELLSNLEKGRVMEASDPRDKIYGLLGIIHGIDVTQSGFEIDYRESWQQVYTRFARNISNATGRCDILSYVIPGIEDSSASKIDDVVLPSWVPNWNRNPYMDSRIKTRTILSTLASNAQVTSQAEKGTKSQRAAWSNDGTVLILKGRILGRMVSLVKRILDLTASHEVMFQAIRDDAPDEKAAQRAILNRWDYIVRSKAYEHQAKRKFRERSYYEPKALGLPYSLVDTSACWSDTDQFRTCSDSNSLIIPSSVESHLYNRSRHTATW